MKFEKKVNLILIPRENGERDARAIIKNASREEKPLMEEGERQRENENWVEPLKTEEWKVREREKHK